MTLVLLLLGGFAVTGSAARALTRSRTTYAAERRLILREGYVPYRLPSRHLTRMACGGDPAICRRYPEVGFCSGAGLADCEFLFAKGRRLILIVHTVGETVPSLRVVGVRRSTRRAVAGLY